MSRPPPNTDAHHEPGPGGQIVDRRARRIKIFFLVFALAALASLAYTFARPALYQSEATLLVEPPRTSIGNGREQARPLNHGAAQHLATEKSLLLSEPVLNQIIVDNDSLFYSKHTQPNPSWLRSVFDATYIADTNVLTVTVEGRDKALQPRFLQAWLDAYFHYRNARMQRSSNSDHTKWRDQLQDLEELIDAQQKKIAVFTAQHDISSRERTENRNIAKLNGLNDAINRAEEDRLRANAALEAMRAAAAAGESITQGRDRTAIERLEERVQEIRDQVAAYNDQFTEKFTSIAPEIQAARENLRRAEQALASKKQKARREALAEAERAAISAQTNYQTLLAQHAALKEQLGEFSQRFSEYEALQQELEQFELQAKPLRERVLQTRLAGEDFFPDVRVLSQPSQPGSPIRPDFRRDASISLGGSFLLALIASLLYDYLNRDTPAGIAAEQMQPQIYSYHTHLLPPDGRPRNVALDHHGENLALDAPAPRELIPAEVSALLKAAPDDGKLLIILLLSGLSREELCALNWSDVDLQQGLINLPHRQLDFKLPEPALPVAGRLAASLSPPAGPLFRDRRGQPLGSEDLDAMINFIAHDAALADSTQIGTQTLRHTYILYLIRQGLKLGELPRLVGSLGPTQLAAYASYASPGGREWNEIERLYPTFHT